MTQGPTRGRRAAIRAAISRRGELGLTQEQLADRAGVSPRTIGMFETGQSWPRARQLGQIERLGLNWPVGHLRELADDVDYPEDAEQTVEDLVDQILESLRDASFDELRIVLASVLRRLAMLDKTDRERAVLEQIREILDRPESDLSK